jgi:cyanophycin synthetase
VVRRDDSLRGRDGDEVPRIIANALRAAGVGGEAITVIPDEQRAVDAALRLGQPGDLLLIFADALARTWKQITKFRPAGEPARPATPTLDMPVIQDEAPDEALAAMLEGMVRDERGLVFERVDEQSD